MSLWCDQPDCISSTEQYPNSPALAQHQAAAHGRCGKGEKIKLGYWAIRGLAAAIRMILTYVEADFEDVQYSDGATWFGKDKPEILKKNALANLPYVVHGDNVVCQTNACFVYLGEQFGLNGSTPQEKIKNEAVLAEVYDLRNKHIDLVYPFRQINKTEEDYKTSAMNMCSKELPTAYAKLEAWLTQNGTSYTVCNTPCVADFHLWEMIDQHEKLAKSINFIPSPIKAFPKLAAIHKNMRNDPKLQAYFASPAYALPCNNPIANAYFQ